MGDMGDLSYPGDGETPAETTVGAFVMSVTSVANDEFSGFLASTGHTTEAERFQWSFVFGGLLPDDFPDTRGAVGAEGGDRSSAQHGTTPKVHGARLRDAATIP